jgi:hypothetical protein
MKPEDEQPSDEELREAAALAAALEGDAGGAVDAAPPADALETAALLRHTRSPIAVPPPAEATVSAQVAPALDARRARGRRRARIWIATTLVAPAAAAAWLLVATTTGRHASLSAPPWTVPPAPTADLLAAQAEATRGGSRASAALARLDLEMRSYRRQYHQNLRNRGEGAP